MARIIDGKAAALGLEQDIAKRVSALNERKIVPCLAVIIAGNDSASQVYVRNKIRACERVGIKSIHSELPSDIPENELIAEIERLNADRTVHGILVQLPLPKHIDKTRVINSISREKDVDCFVPHNVGLIGKKESVFLPCTPAGVVYLLQSSGVEIRGADCVIIGRSDIVGAPLSRMLTSLDATVTLCHSKTKNIKQYAKNADILISAAGRAGFVTADFVKPGAAVIDVGINRTPEGKLTGDVNFEEASKIAGCITPVPGGVGPMTIAMLLQNTLRGAETFSQ